MSIIFLLLALFWIIFIFNIPSLPKQKKGDCPPHKWKWKKQPGMEDLEYLQCEKCGKFPGIEANEEN